MTAEKVQEIRARRAADRQGLRLTKSRRRDPRALDYGSYRLTDTNGETVAGPFTDLDEVESYLSKPRDNR